MALKTEGNYTYKGENWNNFGFDRETIIGNIRQDESHPYGYYWYYRGTSYPPDDLTDYVSYYLMSTQFNAKRSWVNVGNQYGYGEFSRTRNYWDSSGEHETVNTWTAGSPFRFYYYTFQPNKTVLGHHCYSRLSTDLPIFWESDPNVEAAIDRYIQNGDYSGAVNATDLDFPTINYTVSISSGMYPTIGIVGEIESSDYDDSYNITFLDYGVQADQYVNTLTTSDFYSYSWNELTVGTGSPDFVYIKLYPSDSSSESGKFVFVSVNMYGDTSGVVDVSLNGKVHLTITNEEIEGEYPTDNDHYDDVYSYQNYSGANTLTKTYLLSNVNLQLLATELWSTPFLESLLKVNTNPMENIVAVKSMPCVLTGTAETIKIGNYVSAVSALNVGAAADGFKIDVGSFTVPRIFGNFMDYSSVSIQIWLPYIGFKELPAVEIIGRQLTLSYIYNCILGTCVAMIDAVDSSGKLYSVGMYQGECGIDIALTSLNRQAQESAFINGTLNTVSSIANLNPISAMTNAISTAINVATVPIHSESNGVGGGGMFVYASNQAYLVIRRPKKFVPNDYGETFGYPCMLKLKLSDVHGYTVVSNFKTSNIERATDREKEMIKELMNSGVILP